VCAGQHSSYGEPFCQSLKAAAVDVQVTALILRALEPAALEASLAVAADLQAERAGLDSTSAVTTRVGQRFGAVWLAPTKR